MSKEKKYQELMKKYEELEKKLGVIEDDCAKKNMPFDDMYKETYDIRNEMFSISQEARLLQEPTIEFGKTWKGSLYTMDEFKEMCLNNEITDNDGYGYYATETGKSNILIMPSDILENKYRTDFSHVIWLGK